MGRKTMAVALNKYCAQVCIGSKGYKGAVHFTRKATAARIKSDLKRKYPAHQRGGIFHKSRNKLSIAGHGGTKPVPLGIIKASKMLKKKGQSKGLGRQGWRAAVSAGYELILSKRIQSRAYLAAGWINCARDLGVPPNKTRTVKLYDNYGKNPASHSYAIKATSGNLEVRAYNVAVDDEGSRAVAEPALNQAIAEQIRDMETYMQQETEKAMQRAIWQQEYAAKSVIRYA
mgnify:FL=1